MSSDDSSGAVNGTAAGAGAPAPAAIGEFRVVREIHRGPMGSVYLVRGADSGAGGKPGAPGRGWILKTCTPPVDVVGVDAARRLVASFEQRAAVQKRVAASGSGEGGGNAAGGASARWARVVATGSMPGRNATDYGDGGPAGGYADLPGAFAVYETGVNLGPAWSLAGLIASKIDVPGPDVRRWLAQVAQGLSHIRAAAQRGHGELRASNVLLVPSAGAAQGDEALDLGRLDALLTDPAPAWPGGAAAAREEEREVRAFAELAHQLVTHKPYQGGWSGGAERWSDLGAPGAALRKMVHDILDPSASSGDGRVAGFGVADLAGAVEKAGHAGGRRRAVIAGLAAMLVIGGGTAGAFYYKHQRDIARGRVVARWLVEPQAAERWKQFCLEYREWFAKFVQRLDEQPSQGVLAAVQQSMTGAGAAPTVRTRRDLYQFDPELAKALDVLRRAGVTNAVRGAGPAGEPVTPWAMAGVSESMDLITLANEPTQEAKQDASIVATERMQDVMAQVREAVMGWKGPDVLRQGAAELNTLGWTRAGKYLESLAGRLGSQGDSASNLSADVAGDIDAMVAVRPRLESILRRWGNIRASIDKFKDVEDPVLARLEPNAAKLVTDMDGDAGRATDLARLDQQLASIETLAASLAEFAGPGGAWGGVDVDAFRESPEFGALTRETRVSPKLFEDWLTTARKFPSLDPALDPRRAWGVEEALAAIDALKQEFAVEPLEQPVDDATAQRIESLRNDAAAASPRKLFWSRRNQAKVESEAARLKQLAQELRGGLEQRKTARLAEVAAIAQRVRSELAARTEVVSGSAVLATLWQAGRDALLKDTPQERYKQLQRDAEALEQAIRQIDEAVPRPVTKDELDRLIREAGGGGGGEGAGGGGAWAQALADATIAERDRVLGGVVGQTPAKADALAALKPGAEQAGKAFTGYAQSVRDLAGQSARLAAGLSAGFGAAEAGGAGSGVSIQQGAAAIKAHPAMQDARVASALAGLLERCAALEQLGGERSVDRLVGVVQTADASRPELVIEAWRRLGSLGDSGGFPRTQTELEALPSMLDKVRGVLAPIADQTRQRALASDLIDRQRVRLFTAFAASRREPEAMKSALGQRAALGVRVEDLPATLRYNALLLESRSRFEAPGLDEISAFDAGVDIAQKIRALGAEVAGDPRVSAMLAKVADLTRERPDQVKKIDPKTLGPGSIGWSAQEDPNTGRLTFTSPPPANGRGASVTIVFERVEADTALGTDATYIAASETSLRQVLGLTSTPEHRRELESLMPLYEEDAGWVGPRVWEWKPTPAGGVSIAAGSTWLNPDANVTKADPAFAPEILQPGAANSIRPEKGGDPTPDHPMQKLGPAAAAYVSRLAGCRLPTSAEWRAAYQALVVRTGKAGALWNIRDKTFDVQREHILAMQSRVQRKASFQFPDIDIARIDPQAPTGLRAVANRDVDDGVLYFAKVDEDKTPGVLLHHMVGNVAEFVFDDAPALELAQMSAKGVRTVVEKKGAPLKVIGGSALSPTTIPVDTPSAVDLLAAQEGFADVGFRMAFGASGTSIKAEPLALKLRKALSDEALIVAK
ncbi:MAG TPA: hypothetical protein PL072_00110 [Phycisphaerales bacterium]|nr:hypothetical protein [Phycisphaerales bacterium]